MARALGLLDVDGVLNPEGTKPSRQQRPEGFTTIRVRPDGWGLHDKPLRLWLCPEHGSMLTRWAAENDVELVWATTWGWEANVYIAPVVGLPNLPWIGASGFFGPAWKWPAVASYIGSQPVVWFDDDFRLHRAQQGLTGFLEARKGVPTLLHEVDPRIGLTQLDLTAATRWLDKEVSR